MKAFIFDMNGTMIDDMHYHADAWHKIFRSLGCTKTAEESKLHIYGKAAEIFERMLGAGHGFSEEEMEAISRKKEIQYQKDFLPDLKLIRGLDNFLENAHRKEIPMSIGTAAPRSNVDYVYTNLPVEKFFCGYICADEVEKSKPDPEVFLKCAKLMQVAAEDCIVFEDSPMGIRAAANAGMKAVAIITFHPKEDFEDYNNILLIIDDFEDERLEVLLK